MRLVFRLINNDKFVINWDLCFYYGSRNLGNKMYICNANNQNKNVNVSMVTAAFHRSICVQLAVAITVSNFHVESIVFYFSLAPPSYLPLNPTVHLPLALSFSCFSFAFGRREPKMLIDFMCYRHTVTDTDLNFFFSLSLFSSALAFGKCNTPTVFADLQFVSCQRAFESYAMNSSRADSADGNNLNTPTNEHVASFIWGAGHLSAAFYNTTSMELLVTHEAVDLKPDFWHLKNLFRQMKMVNVLASGPPIFLHEIMKMLGLPDKSDPSLYRVNRVKTLTAAEFIVYTNNEKTLISNRKRILELELPRMTAEFSEQDRYNFLSALLPLHQNLLVQCLGNLLNYLDANWKHLFLRNDHRPIITDIHVHHLDEQVLMDESTFNALKIFAAKDHPSGFKMCTIGSSKEGCSFYNIVSSSCVSRIGLNELRGLMQRPTRDVNELQMRFATIDWCRVEQNATHLTRIKTYLRNVGNIGELYGKLVRAQDQPMLWKSFKRTLYYANCVWEYCVHLIDDKAPHIDGTLIKQIGEHMKDHNVLENMLDHIDIIVDLEQSLKFSKFCVNFGLDAELDAKKDKFSEVINILTTKAAEEINNLPEYVHELTVHCVNEMGFLIGELLALGEREFAAFSVF